MFKSFVDIMKACLPTDNKKTNPSNVVTVGEICSVKNGNNAIPSSPKFNQDVNFILNGTFGGIDSSSIKSNIESDKDSTEIMGNLDLIRNLSLKNSVRTNSDGLSPTFSLPSNSNEDEKIGKDSDRKSLLFSINKEADPEKSIFCMNDNVILDQEVEQAPKLTLEDDTGTLLRKRIVKINAAGSKESLRRMRDGYTFFGPVDIYKNCIINDFIVETKDTDKRLFVVFYNQKKQKYFFRMLGVSNGIYCCKKLLTHFSLVDSKRNYFQIGTTTVQIEPKGSAIKITVFINKNDKLEYEFTKDKRSIVIGRKSTNDIRINSTLLSKEHCSINFKDDHWEINDGHKGKFSTNGTWIMMKSEFELLGNFTYIKIGGDIIKITICP